MDEITKIFIEKLNKLDIEDKSLTIEESKILFLLKFLNTKLEIIKFEPFLKKDEEKYIKVNGIEKLIEDIILMRRMVSSEIECKYKERIITIVFGPKSNNYYKLNYFNFRGYGVSDSSARPVVNIIPKDLFTFMTYETDKFAVLNIKNDIIKSLDELLFTIDIYKFKNKKYKDSEFKKLLKENL